MLVQKLLEHSAVRSPDKTALVCGSRRFTYSQIDVMANRMSRGMISSGLHRGDRVGIYLGNCFETVVSIFAVLKAGGVFVLVNPSTKKDKLIYILRNCGAKGWVAGERAAEGGLLNEVMQRSNDLSFAVLTGRTEGRAEIESERVWHFDSLQANFADTPPPSVNIDLDLACLIYTSGTTGEPKGVMTDHGNANFVAASIRQYLDNNETDIILNALPLSFDYGLYQLLMTFGFGGTLVLEESFAFPGEILKRAVEERVTGFPGVPTMFSVLMQMDLKELDLRCLRYITNTAAALPVNHIQDLRKKLPGVKIFSMYGLTETKRTLYLPPEELDRRPSSVGIPIPGTEAWLEDSHGCRLPNGCEGELVVRGRHVMRGYWGDPMATAERYPDGPIPGERVCRTGDLFRTDKDGFFYFVARKDDILKCRGEKVAPKEVENVLYRLEGVIEAAVIGVPDPIQGQAIKALLVVRGRQFTQVQVQAHCRKLLEEFMVPKYVEFLNELPKTASGKISKKELAQTVRDA